MGDTQNMIAIFTALIALIASILSSIINVIVPYSFKKMQMKLETIIAFMREYSYVMNNIQNNSIYEYENHNSVESRIIILFQKTIAEGYSFLVVFINNLGQHYACDVDNPVFKEGINLISDLYLLLLQMMKNEVNHNIVLYMALNMIKSFEYRIIKKKLDKYIKENM